MSLSISKRRILLIMVLFVISIIVMNSVVFKMKKDITKNQLVHIWVFTTLLVTWADMFLDERGRAYWYFHEGVSWDNLLVYTLLIPPVSVMIVNWFPLLSSWLKKLRYLAYWFIFMLSYELLALLPQPWGFFHYGWWKFGYSIVEDPFLLLILVTYYKWIRKVEKTAH